VLPPFDQCPQAELLHRGCIGRVMPFVESWRRLDPPSNPSIPGWVLSRVSAELRWLSTMSSIPYAEVEAEVEDEDEEKEEDQVQLRSTLLAQLREGQGRAYPGDGEEDSDHAEDGRGVARQGGRGDGDDPEEVPEIPSTASSTRPTQVRWTMV